MQKKILASLLMVPMAYSAFANIEVNVPVDKDSWTANGLVGENLKFDSEAGSIETIAPVGVGNLTYIQENMPQGTYTLTFASKENVLVKVNGKELSANGEFTLDAAGNVTIVVAGEDPSKIFKFTGLNLEIVCDFDAIQEALTKKLMDNLYKMSGNVNTALTAVNADALAAKFENSEALVEEANSLNEKIGVGGLNDKVGGVRGMIREIREGIEAGDKNSANYNFNKAVEIYNKYELWKGAEGNTAAVAIDALIEEVNTHNEAVKTLNDRWNTYQTNLATKARDERMLESYQKELDALQAKIDAAAKTPAYGEYGKYISDTTADEMAAAQAHLDDLKAQVEAMYPEDKMADAIIGGIGDADMEMDDAIGAATDEFNKANADVAAYVAWLNATRDLLATYKGANTTVSALTGVEGYETVPDAYKAQILKDLEDLYNTTVANFGIKEGVIEGAAGFWKNDEAVIKNISNALTQVAKVAADKVNGQNEFMNYDLEAFAHVQEGIDAIVAPKGANGEEIAAKKAEIQAALDELKALVEETYGKLALQVEDFSPKIQAINQDVKDLAAIVAPLSDLQKKLDDAIAEIAKDHPEIADKFATVEGNLQEAIDALGLDSTKEEIDVVSNAIDEMLANADKLQEKWDDAKAAVAEFDASMKSLNDIFADKLIVEGNDFDVEAFKAANADYKALFEDHTKFLADYEAAKAAESQDCYNAMVALIESYSAGTIENNVLDITKAFESEGTTGNVDVVDAALTALKTAAEGTYAGKDDIDATIATYTEGLNELKQSLATADSDVYVDTETITTEYGKIDEACETMLEEIAKVQETIKNLKEYQAIYDQFTADLGALQDAINADTEYNETEGNSTEPAKSFWTSEIAKIQDAKDALAGKIDAALAAYGDTDKNIKAQKDALQAEYDKLLAQANGIQQDIEHNEKANTYLLNLSNNIRTAINSEIDALTEKMNHATAQGANDIAKELQEWINELNALLINSTDPIDLASIDLEEKGFFAVGEADDNWEALKAKYDAVSAKFKELQKTYNDKYAADLEAWNNAFLDTAWEASMNDLLQAYKDAIKTYDQYLYGLKNPGYKAYIAETLQDHRDIYNYIDAINNLGTDVQEWVAAQTAAGKLISAADFKVQATDKSDALQSEIETEVTTMETEVAQKAEEFYNINLPEAQKNIADATRKMQENGVSDDVISETLAEQNNNLDKAIQLEDKAKTDDNLSYGIQMDFVATYLDNAKVQPDLNAAAQTQWTADLFAADATVAELNKQIEDAEFATGVEAEKAKFDAAVEAIAALKAAPHSPAEIDTLLGLQDALQAALDQAKEAADAIKANSDNNKANQDIYNKYVDVVLPDFNNQLAELEKFVNSLAVGNDSYLTAPKAAVDALASFVEANKSNLTEKATDLGNLKSDIESAIDSAYGTAVFNENALLTEWLGKLKAAYNDAKVNAGIDEFDTEYKDVKDFIDSNNPLPLGTYTPDFDATAYSEKAVELERGISSYYNELQKLWSEDLNGNENPDKNPLVAAQGKVAEAEDAAGIALNDAYAALQGYENLKNVDADKFAEYEKAYQDFLAEYEAIQSEAAAEGSRLILNWEKFVAEYEALKAKIDNTADAAKLAEDKAKAEADKQAASDAKYAELLEVYNGLETEYEALKNKVADYGIDNTAVNDALDQIAEDLETAKNKLDEAKAAYTLTDDSTLYGEDGIRSTIFSTGLDAAEAYANKGVEEAWAVNADLNKALKKNVVPEIAKALLAEQTTHKVQLEEIENAIADTDKTDIDTTAASYEELYDQAAAIKARLEAMIEEATEAIFVLGDVDLDPDGLVTASDVQLLIQWVGEGKTYEDLYALNPVIAAAANVVQEPGAAPEISIADVTAEIDLVMNADYDTPTARTFVQRRAAAQGSINAIALGDGRYAIALNSTQAFVAGQFDIVLPAGSEIVSAEIAGMSHQLYRFSNDGYTRMIVASMSNEELKGDQLLIIEVQGNGAPVIEGAVFTDANANAYTLGNTTTGIDNIGVDNSGAQRIYNAAGQVMRSIQRGINIIRHSDGTTTKELHK